MWVEAQPVVDGWYWWRQDASAEALPVRRALGPFGNNSFLPGRGWMLASKIGGQWWSAKIEYPESGKDKTGFERNCARCGNQYAGIGIPLCPECMTEKDCGHTGPETHYRDGTVECNECGEVLKCQNIYQ